MTPNDKERMLQVNDLIEDIVSDKIDLPENALIFLDAETMLKVITPRRLELIKLVEQNKTATVNQLANLSKRHKQAVVRDLKLLERLEIIEQRKEGRNVFTSLKRKMLLLPLTTSILEKEGSRGGLAAHTST
jgi:predicted transcriptional regulator